MEESQHGDPMVKIEVVATSDSGEAWHAGTLLKPGDVVQMPLSSATTHLDAGHAQLVSDEPPGPSL